jgi:hypothetical protein
LPHGSVNLQRRGNPFHMRCPGAVVSVVITILIAGSSAAATSEGLPASSTGLLAGLVPEHAPHSYAATLKAEFRERSFPFVHVHLNGNVYYRAPDHYAVVFKDPPPFMRGFAEGYATMMNVGSWSQHFAAAAEPDQTIDGREVRVIRLSGLDPNGALRDGEIFVDPLSNEIVAMDWHMSSGMTFTIHQDFEETLGGFNLVSTQHATFAVPFAHGTATMTLTDYRCNVQIADDVFK